MESVPDHDDCVDTDPPFQLAEVNEPNSSFHFKASSESNLELTHGLEPPSQMYDLRGLGGVSRGWQARKRRLMVDLKTLCDKLECADSSEVQKLSSNLEQIQKIYRVFLNEADALTDRDLACDLLEGLTDQFEQCCYLNDEMLCKFSANLKKNDFDKIDLGESASQVGGCSTVSTSSKIAVQKIEIKRKRVENKIKRDLEIAKAAAAADSARAAAEARFKLEEAQLEAEEELASLSGHGSMISTGSQISSKSRLKKYASEVPKHTSSRCGPFAQPTSSKNNFVNCKPDASQVETADFYSNKWVGQKHVQKEKLNPVVKQFIPVKQNVAGCSAEKMRPDNAKTYCARRTPDNADTGDHLKLHDKLVNAASDNAFPQRFYFNDRVENVPHFVHAHKHAFESNANADRLRDFERPNHEPKRTVFDRPRVGFESNGVVGMTAGGGRPLPVRMPYDHNFTSYPTNDESVFKTYLDRQGRNEFVNLASQIGFNGSNIAFVFYENQIRQLMKESVNEERKLEALRASCVGQPREMVNLFLAPMKSVSTKQRIEMALDRLRQRYGVPAGLTSEPKIIEIRNGPSVSFNVNSLKQFNEDLNTLEVFAYAHDEYQKLSGQLLLDVASRLPGNLKRRYLDYLSRLKLDLNRPGFDSLRRFILHELSVMSSDYAQTFFKSGEDKDKSRGSSGWRGPVRVRQVAVKSNDGAGTETTSTPHFAGEANDKERNARGSKPAPLCFVCNNSTSKHFLANCPKFRCLSDHDKRQTVMKAGRCLNCLAIGHYARQCSFKCKCFICGPDSKNKHAGALHEYFLKKSDNLGAANEAKVGASGLDAQPEQAVSRRLTPNYNGILLRTSAVRVINPTTGKSTLAYAQHDTASQATLISKRLKHELNLDVKNDSVIIRTLADQTTKSAGLAAFNLQSLVDDEIYPIVDALVVPDFTAEDCLPHTVHVAHLENFKGVDIPIIADRDQIDILIGQADKALLAVLKEREGTRPDEPNLVLTRLGPIASGGRADTGICKTFSARKAKISESDELPCECECERLKNEISNLKEALHAIELDDETIQPSKSEEIARKMVASSINLKDGRYEIAVPLKTEIAEKLPNNFQSAANRTVSLRQKALKNDQLKQILVDTFQELIAEGWLIPIDEPVSVQDKAWYLPFFVSRQDKPRVVFDGAATFRGKALNDAVLPGINLLNGLVEVLLRFRLGKFACMADISKCFFQISMPQEQQDLFRLIWYKNNDLLEGETQVYRFTRHVWGINSSPYIALFAIEQLVKENPTNASQLTLNAIETKRYMDDVLLSFNSIEELELVARESIKLFASRGFKLRKWAANGASKSILLNVPQKDLVINIREIDLTSQFMPDSKALGLVWDVENDTLRMCSRRGLQNVSCRREMLSVLASQFDPLGYLAPCLLKGKLILQRVTALGIDWDDALPGDVLHDWRVWVESMEPFVECSIPRCCFPDAPVRVDGECDGVVYQLHGFSDASNSAIACVVYLRRVDGGDKPSVAFIQGKSRVVLANQTGWVISRKELEAAKMCSELMLAVSRSLAHLDCSLHFWTDSQVVLRWIINPDLHLARFVKRRVDRVLQVAPADAWNYVNTLHNPADVGTREDGVKRSSGHAFWLSGPRFLLEPGLDAVAPFSSVSVKRLSVKENELVEIEQTHCYDLDQLINTSPDLYALKKRWSYLLAFKTYFVEVKVKRGTFCRPELNAEFLEDALLNVIRYVQYRSFGAAVELLKKDSPDAFEAILKRLGETATNAAELKRVSELKSLRELRPCVDNDMMLRVDGRLENAELPVECKHPLILPGKHALTRLIVLNEHVLAGHAGPAYTLMQIRQRFWIIFGISNVKRILSECSVCARKRATPIRQLMSDLPAFRVAATNKPFWYCGVDYLGPFYFRQNRSDCKAWGLLFTCLCTRCIHVEMVTSLDLNSFLLAFSRFMNLRGPVDTMFSDNGSTFKAAASQLPLLLASTELHNSLRKRGINWKFSPPYSPSQGGCWEIMVKLFKKALNHVLEGIRRKPSLIELQTFTSDAVRIVNDRPLTTLSSKPNDLAPVTPSSFLGQRLAPYTPLSTFHDRGDLRRDYTYNATLAHRFWLGWIKGYLPTLQRRAKWRTTKENLTPGQLVLVGDAEDITKRGAYRLGRVHAVHPQIRKGKEIVRRATLAVLKNTGSGEIEYILRDVSKIAPI